MRKTMTTPAMCTRCGEPYVAVLRPRPLVTTGPGPAPGQPVGGRLTVIGDVAHLVERHRPCTGPGAYR